jgi:hypothetical protein
VCVGVAGKTQVAKLSVKLSKKMEMMCWLHPFHPFELNCSKNIFLKVKTTAERERLQTSVLEAKSQSNGSEFTTMYNASVEVVG